MAKKIIEQYKNIATKVFDNMLAQKWDYYIAYQALKSAYEMAVGLLRELDNKAVDDLCDLYMEHCDRIYAYR